MRGWRRKEANRVLALVYLEQARLHLYFWMASSSQTVGSRKRVIESPGVVSKQIMIGNETYSKSDSKTDTA